MGVEFEGAASPSLQARACLPQPRRRLRQGCVHVGKREESWPPRVRVLAEAPKHIECHFGLSSVRTLGLHAKHDVKMLFREGTQPEHNGVYWGRE